MSTYLIAGGGTGGHLYPALAVGLELQRRGHTVALAGEKEGMEASVAPLYGFAFHALPRFSLQARDLAAGHWWRGRAQAQGLLREIKPSALLLAGGRTSVLLGWAASSWLAAVFPRLPAPTAPPVLLLEQNAVPGRANRWLARLPVVRGIACTFEEAVHWFPSDRDRRPLGCPIRPAILQASREEGLSKLGLDPQRATVVILGGSRGAPALHEAVLAALPLWHANEWFREHAQVVHLGGWVNRPELTGGSLPTWYHYIPYLEEMGWAFACADLMVARAGASGLAEMAARGLPAVLVPWPLAADNHQQANARCLQRRGGVVVLPESECKGPRLADLVAQLLVDRKRRQAMGAAMRSWSRPDAAARVADWMQALTGGGT